MCSVSNRIIWDEALTVFRRFPWYWYTLEHTLEPSGTKIRIIMFETTIPCGIGTNSIDGVPIDFAMAEEQWSWFEKELQDSQE